MATQGLRVRRTASAALAWMLVAGAGSAAGADVQGNRLLLERPCGDDGGTVSIVADPSLTHAVEIDGSTGEVTTNVDQVTVAGSCHGDGDATIRVPTSFPVTVDSWAAGDLRLGDLDGAVTVHLRGQGDLDAGRLGGGLFLDDTGQGDVSVGALAGKLVANLYGSGDLVVGRLESDSVAITETGHGDVALRDGVIGRISATLAGSGDLSVGATVDGGEVVSTGAGDASFARVLGRLSQVRTGPGDIVVHEGGGSQDGRGASGRSAQLSDRVLAHVLRFGRVGGLAVGAGRWWRGRRRARPIAAARDPRVSATLDRLDQVARRVGRLEALVTSREFELNRSFREMGD